MECHLRRPCSPPMNFGSRLSLGNISFPTYPLEELHTKPRLGARRYNGKQKVSRPSSSASTFRFPNGDRWLPTPIRPVVATYPYPTYKNQYCETMEQWKTAVRYRVALCISGILTLRPPGWGLHSWASKKERSAIAQPHQGIEHGALSRNSQMLTPVPITPRNED